MRELIKAFKALSDETRLRMINLLLEGECCVCEVMQALDISQTRASRNLNILYDVGFLRMRKDGLWSHYSLDREGQGDFLPLLIAAVEQGLKDSSVATEDRKRLNTAKQPGADGVKCCSG